MACKLHPMSKFYIIAVLMAMAIAMSVEGNVTYFQLWWVKKYLLKRFFVSMKIENVHGTEWRCVVLCCVMLRCVVLCCVVLRC